MWVIKLLLILLLVSKEAIATNLIYSDEYNVKFTSKNIQIQKEESINLIKKNSFEKIIHSFLTNKGVDRLNAFLNDDFINSFLFSIDIYEEKIVNNKYSSKVQLAFDNKKIIDFFLNNNIDFVPYQPENFLLIIFDQKYLSEKTLSKENSFYKFLLKNKNNYQYFSLPYLDINDRYIINKQDFELKKITNYDLLVKKYDNKNILLIHSYFNSENVKISSYVYEENKFKIIDEISFDLIDYDLFFDDFELKFLEYWKKQNLVRTSIKKNIKCRIKTLNQIELKEIKEIINKNNIIKNLNADEISYNNSIYNLFYYGNLNILKKSLYKNNIDLNIVEDKCNIKIL